MINFLENKLIIKFTQSNAYGIRQLKISENEVKINKSNMKKITIDRASAEQLLNFYGKDNQLPSLFRGFKIQKSEIINLYNEIKNDLSENLFNGGSKVFEIDRELLDAPEEIKGNIMLGLRDKGRDELVITFLAFSADGKLISKKSQNSYLQFNNAVFSCVFHDFVIGIIDLATKQITFKINNKKIMEAGLGLSEVKKYNRRTKEELMNE